MVWDIDQLVADCTRNVQSHASSSDLWSSSVTLPCAQQVSLRMQLWQGKEHWAAKWRQWLATPFFKLDVVAMDNAIHQCTELVTRLTSALPIPNTARLLIVAQAPHGTASASDA